MNTAALLDAITTVDPLSRYGKITKVIGLIAEAIGPPDVALGELCILGDPETSKIRAEVVGFRDGRVLRSARWVAVVPRQSYSRPACHCASRSAMHSRGAS